MAPQCSTMYAISSALRRKLIGTRIRPNPLTPKNEVNRRAEFCDTTATRSPAANAERVESGGLGAARARAISRPRQRTPRRRRLVGLVDDADAIAVDELGPLEEVVDRQRYAHGGSPSTRAHRERRRPWPSRHEASHA